MVNIDRYISCSPKIIKEFLPKNLNTLDTDLSLIKRNTTINKSAIDRKCIWSDNIVKILLRLHPLNIYATAITINSTGQIHRSFLLS